MTISFCLVTLLVSGVGCRSIGPGTVKRDRMHYSSAVADSWKEQLLLNIVKSRYADAPAFLEVSSVVAGYSLETGVNVNGQFSPENLRGDTFLGGEVSGKFTDRPTISYLPLTGEKFARSLMAPVPLDSLLFTLQGGVPADLALGLILQSVQGCHNRRLSAGDFQPADPEFLRALELFRRLQDLRALETEIVREDSENQVWLRFHPPRHATNGEASVAELKRLLQIPEEMSRARVVFGMVAEEPGVVAMRTRSLMQILTTLGAGVAVDPEDLAEGKAFPVSHGPDRDRFVVQTAREKPERAFVAVPYEGRWFWIDSGDLASKTTLAMVTVLFNFLEGGGAKTAPVLTIPAN